MLEPDDVADAVVAGLATEEFLILPHPEVAEYFRRKADDYERWLRRHAPAAEPLRPTHDRERRRPTADAGRARPAGGRRRAVPPQRGRAVEGGRRGAAASATAASGSRTPRAPPALADRARGGADQGAPRRHRVGAAGRAGGAHRADEAPLRRRLSASVAALAVVALVVFAQACRPGPSRSASIGGDERRRVPDGSMTVSEDVTYDFDGAVQPPDPLVRLGHDHRAAGFEGSTSWPSSRRGAPAALPFQWAIPNTSGRHTYTFSYTVLGAITRRGRRRRAELAVHRHRHRGADRPRLDLDQGAGRRRRGRAWAHGPLNGEVTVTANLVGLVVEHLPARHLRRGPRRRPDRELHAGTGPTALLPGILVRSSRTPTPPTPPGPAPTIGSSSATTSPWPCPSWWSPACSASC